MSTPQRPPQRASQPTPKAPRTRSPFAAAFLSLIFPGLGHAYDGAYARALGFAAVPLLLLALGGGVVLRVDRGELLGFVANPTVLVGALIANVLFLVYRIIAAVDAWQVARYLNAADASGGGRLGRARLPLHPASIVGLVAVIVVMAAGHLAIARYNVLAMDLVNCVFSADGEDANCDTAAAESEAPTETMAPASIAPAGSGIAVVPSITPNVVPTPIASATGTLAPTLPPWDGKERLNVLLVGADTREKSSSFNTDTLIVASVDPVTKQVAMFQVPRDMADVPVPDNARGLWGSTYGGKINSWYNQNRTRTDLWPGKKAETRGFNALKAILGKLYGLDIRYYVKVDFAGFRKVVDTVGGVQVNVQMPVYESEYPAPGGLTRIYIPAGPQHMTGGEALRYARSRHRAQGGDFDRGRRQQRVLLSLREQMSAQAIIANLPSLVKTLGSSVKTDIPVSELPKFLALAEAVDTKNIRSYVFSPSFYATEFANSPRGYIITPNVVRIRRAVKEAFSIKADVLALRDRLGAESAGVWVLNGSGRSGLSVDTADYLTYSGVDASAPNRKAPAQPSTSIVVYNGAEGEMPETVKYLEKVVRRDRDDRDRPDGHRGRDRHARPGRPQAHDQRGRLGLDPRQPAPVLGQVSPHGGKVALADQARDRADRAGSDRPVIDLDDRAHLDTRPAQERLVAHVELRPVDGADLRRDAGVMCEGQHRPAGHALEDVVRHRRREQRAITHNEQVRGRRLGGMAAGREDERLVEAVELRLGLLERHVDVAAHDLAAGGQCLVGVPAPGRGHDPDTLLDVDVVPEGGRDHVQLVLEVVEADPDRPGALVERRADVDVLREGVAPDRLQDDLHQVVHRRQIIHEQHLRAAADALHVLPEEQARTACPAPRSSTRGCPRRWPSRT